MPIRLPLGEKSNRKIWLHAGVQLNEDITFDEKEGRLDHIAPMITDYENVFEKCFAWGCIALPAGNSWLKMSNSIVIELRRGNNEVLHTIISQKPWVDQEREYAKISSCKRTK